jgi:hypothetical protein
MAGSHKIRNFGYFIVDKDGEEVETCRECHVIGGLRRELVSGCDIMRKR